MRSLIVMLVACGAGTTERPAEQAAAAPRLDGHCRDKTELAAHNGKPCIVTGTYSLKTFFEKSGRDPIAKWPIVTLTDGTNVMIESLWDPSMRPDDPTIARFNGKVVVVTGTLHSFPPRGMPQNFMHWTISPVTSIELR